MRAKTAGARCSGRVMSTVVAAVGFVAVCGGRNLVKKADSVSIDFIDAHFSHVQGAVVVAPYRVWLPT